MLEQASGLKFSAEERANLLQELVWMANNYNADGMLVDLADAEKNPQTTYFRINEKFGSQDTRAKTNILLSGLARLPDGVLGQGLVPLAGKTIASGTVSATKIGYSETGEEVPLETTEADVIGLEATADGGMRFLLGKDRDKGGKGIGRFLAPYTMDNLRSLSGRAWPLEMRDKDVAGILMKAWYPELVAPSSGKDAEGSKRITEVAEVLPGQGMMMNLTGDNPDQDSTTSILFYGVNKDNQLQFLSTPNTLVGSDQAKAEAAAFTNDKGMGMLNGKFYSLTDLSRGRWLGVSSRTAEDKSYENFYRIFDAKPDFMGQPQPSDKPTKTFIYEDWDPAEVAAYHENLGDVVSVVPDGQADLYLPLEGPDGKTRYWHKGRILGDELGKSFAEGVALYEQLSRFGLVDISASSLSDRVSRFGLTDIMSDTDADYPTKSFVVHYLREDLGDGRGAWRRLGTDRIYLGTKEDGKIEYSLLPVSKGNDGEYSRRSAWVDDLVSEWQDVGAAQEAFDQEVKANRDYAQDPTMEVIAKDQAAKAVVVEPGRVLDSLTKVITGKDENAPTLEDGVSLVDTAWKDLVAAHKAFDLKANRDWSQDPTFVVTEEDNQVMQEAFAAGVQNTKDFVRPTLKALQYEIPFVRDWDPNLVALKNEHDQLITAYQIGGANPDDLKMARQMADIEHVGFNFTGTPAPGATTIGVTLATLGSAVYLRSAWAGLSYIERAMISEALSIGVPNVASKLGTGKFLDADANAALFLVGLALPAASQISAAGARLAAFEEGAVAMNALRAVGKLGAASASEALLFGQVQAVSSSASQAFQGQAVTSSGIYSSFWDGSKVGAAFGAGMGLVGLGAESGFLASLPGAKIMGKIREAKGLKGLRPAAPCGA